MQYEARLTDGVALWLLPSQPLQLLCPVPWCTLSQPAMRVNVITTRASRVEVHCKGEPHLWLIARLAQAKLNVVKEQKIDGDCNASVMGNIVLVMLTS